MFYMVYGTMYIYGNPLEVFGANLLGTHTSIAKEIESHTVLFRMDNEDFDASAV